jgi:hypothetical protein
MSVSYDKEMRKAAQARGESLATVAVSGVEFQGPVTAAERLKILRMITDLFAAHTGPDGPIKPFDPTPDAVDQAR